MASEKPSPLQEGASEVGPNAPLASSASEALSPPAGEEAGSHGPHVLFPPVSGASGSAIARSTSRIEL